MTFNAASDPFYFALWAHCFWCHVEIDIFLVVCGEFFM